MFRTLFGSKDTPVVKGAYLYLSSTSYIVAALHQNSAGILFEQNEAKKFDGRPDAAELGTAFRDAFERFSFSEQDLSGAKKSEWPAFRASKLSSVQRFESSYRMVACMSLNSSNSVVRASIAHPTESDIELAISFNPQLPPQKVGEQLLKLIACADPALARPYT